MTRPTAPQAVYTDDDLNTWTMVVRALRHVLPYADLEDLDRSAPIIEEVELDADEFAQLMTAVAEESGVVVPAQEYSHVVSIDDLWAYVRSHRDVNP